MKLAAAAILLAATGYLIVVSRAWWPLRVSRSAFWRDALPVEVV